MDQNRIKNLLSKYFNNTITQTELSMLMQEFECEGDQDLEKAIDEILPVHVVQTAKFSDERKDLVLSRTLKAVAISEDESRKIFWRKKRRQWLSVAAAFVLISALALFFLGKSGVISATYIARYFGNEISLPAKNQAVVTLHDGRKLDLLDADAETLKSEGIFIKTDKGGRPIFVINETANVGQLQNTFSSPKGISSQLLLADGTQVWLNSGASITYPTRFDQQNRKVSINGEAYFEVFPNQAKPFEVSIGNTKIKVLGTHFNVSNQQLAGEVHTTLMEGSVQVTTATADFKLSPGNQVVSNEKSGAIAAATVDVRGVLAWKNGYYRFSDENIYSVLNKIKLWYAIEGFDVLADTGDRFTGSVQRTKNLSDLLRQLEKVSDYKFKIKDGRVIVMN